MSNSVPFLRYRDVADFRNGLNFSKNSHDFMMLLEERLGQNFIGPVDTDKKIWQIQQGQQIQGETTIQLQSDKQKLFVLQGKTGIDLLDSIEKEIHASGDAPNPR